MKKNITKIATIGFAMLGLTAQAQWTENANAVFLTNGTKNLGIGTSAPAFLIDAQHTGNATASFKSVTGNSNLIIDRGNSGATSSVSYRTAGSPTWQSGTLGTNNFAIRNVALGAAAMSINASNSFVGIGTNAPTEKLHVVGNSKVTGNFSVSNNSSFGASMNVGGSVTATGALNGTSVISTGAINGATVTATGAINGGSVTATGLLKGASVTATGALNSKTLNVSGLSTLGDTIRFGSAEGFVDGGGNTIGALGSIVPASIVGRDLGSTSAQWQNIYAAGNVTIGGTLSIAKLATFNNGINVIIGNIASGDDLYTGTGNGVINCGGDSMNALINIIGDADNHSVVNGDEDLYVQDDLEVGSVAYKPGGGSWTTISDERLKRDVKEYNEGLTQIMKVHTVKFKYNDKIKLMDQDKEYVGVLAQELKEVAPYMVTETTMFEKSHEDENGMLVIDAPGEKYFTVDNSAMTYMLVNAVKELNTNAQRKDNTIANLMDENNALKQRLDNMEECMNKLCNAAEKTTLETASASKSSLDQNQPNPFNQLTVINYKLNTGDQNAQIIVRDLSGNMVKQINLNQTGKGQVTINANELAQGTYTYTLMVSGQSIDTKLMVLVK